MEIKTKYQYTYFIKPFFIKENKYDKYLLRLLEDENYTLRIFEKERDLNLYNYFLQNVRDYFFPTFSYNKDKVKKLEKMDNDIKSLIMSKLHCNIFEYNLNQEIQGEFDDNRISFDINKIEIICLDTGICFLMIKTALENAVNFSEVLNFNYKFKDINSDYYKLRAFNNIKIQTDKFTNMKELSNFINDVIGADDISLNNKELDIYNKRFFTYSYVCIDQNYWNEANKFEYIEDEFFKLNNVLSNNYNSNINKGQLDNNSEEMAEWEYTRFGFTKQSGSLLSSNIDIRNYTTLAFEYESEYLYTLIMSLHQRIYLKKINSECKEKKNINTIIKKFTKFTKEVWMTEITNSKTGSLVYNNWRKVFELDKIYEEIRNKYDIIYKELGIDSNRKLNKAIIVILIISLILNILNFITLIELR